ncbi:MAG: peptidoglycan DD-metalloendopeptidase family protein [Herminiimonas sp.]|nr:peptidoglycan DD-metalloendopeptidase family protein [Herminiimonas sp.]
MTLKTLRPLVLSSLCSLLLAGCNTPRSPAPVTERGTTSRPAEATRGGSSSANLPRAVDARGYYAVRRGDTLAHIALEFGQNYRDLVTWNNLANANDIKVDQVLRVIAPDAGSGAPQAASVNTSSGVEVRALGTAPGAAAAAVAPPVAAVPNKNGPKGDKRPFSESALAELQRPDSPNNTTTSPAPAAATAARPGDARIGEKPAAPAPPAAGIAGTPAPAEDENISWMWPTEGKVATGFDDGKKGIDIIGRSGQQVLAAGSGKVMYAGSGLRGYGNLVIVRHTSNLLSAYAHNKTILVKEGQSVTKGQKIAEMGNSDSDVVKLHFEIRQQGKPVDPSKFLPVR